MSELQDLVGELTLAFADIALPQTFLDAYDQLECLANGRGTETYLVQQKGSEKLCVAKCYDRSLYPAIHESGILKSLHHPGLPTFEGEYQDEGTVCIVREYIEGTPLNQYAEEKNLSNKEVVALCAALCDILAYLHGQKEPVIHRDIKPQNVIIRPDGSPVLIDFDIARVYRDDAEVDTLFMGTRQYAPPEQYGFTQTDSRADIYSLGVLLRYLLTGNPRPKESIRIDKPLSRIIQKCTAFAPKERFANATAVKKALLVSDPRSQALRKAGISLAALLVVGLLALGGLAVYRYVTFDPFADGHIPAVMTDAQRVTDAVSYLNDKYGVNLFPNPDDYMTIGLVKTVLTDLYDFPYDYAHAVASEEGAPHESDAYFLPWGMGDEQYVDRETMTYVAVKIHWPEVVADWSSLKDDNGYYPGNRVAAAFAQQHGILTGVGRPLDITQGEAAILLANADRVYEALNTK